MPRSEEIHLFHQNSTHVYSDMFSVFLLTKYNNVIEYIKWTLTDGFSLLTVMQLYLKSVKSCIKLVGTLSKNNNNIRKKVPHKNLKISFKKFNT